MHAAAPVKNENLPGAVIQNGLWRSIFLLTVTFGILVNWLAPHPPMTDLPQHAGQVALLRDILLNQSPWAELFRINWFTPYVIGYGLALPLSLFMPIATAFKLMLSIAFVAFVWMCIKLRQHFGGDARLDWLFPLPFFGFAYQWGFLTFLLAAPIGLWFILLADRFASNPSFDRGLGLTLTGILLLASHGLVFVFAAATGGLLLLVRIGTNSKLARPIIPYVILGLLCGIYFLISRHMQAGMESSISSEFIWSGGFSRLPKALVYSLGVNASGIEPLVFIPAAIALFALPWLLGLRINWRNTPGLLPFAMVAFIMLAVPTFALDTQFLYQRFGLFLIPAYAWAFMRGNDTPPPSTRNMLAALVIVTLLTWAALVVHAAKAWNFRQATAEIDQQISHLKPGQRALMLMFSPGISSHDKANILAHYPAWYQAERQGLVDFNFAWFPPQIVRYRPEQLPAVAPGFEWHPERFDWAEHQGDDYRYFFVHRLDQSSADPFGSAGCKPALVFDSAEWKIYERRSCPG